ncbi:carboxypeptidase-like regulatory domain-containing protein [Geofilum sp. OHC36d9]|uniref:carboxypeptidase-like regulatory domain-containing protein n=1 Tax=Geofilum sp. OHC36d9 TaxID=3458413 RepID=UPI00403377A6
MNIYKRNSRILFFSFFILLINNACEKNVEYEKLSGQLVGYVQLFDNKRILLSDNSGVEITLEGSSSEIKVYTNESGQYVIDNLETGTYNILFNKDGYGQYKIYGKPFVGGNKPTTLGQRYLYQFIDCQIDNVQITEIEDAYYPSVFVTANALNQNEHPYPWCRYYLSNKQTVSYENYISSTADHLFYDSGDFNFILYIDTLQFPTGSELYLIMYPAISSYEYNYTDINTGKEIYTTVNYNNPSNVASIIIPEFE